MEHLIPTNSTHDIPVYPSFLRIANAANAANATNATSAATEAFPPTDYVHNCIFIAAIGIYLLLGAPFWSITGPSQENERRIRERFSWFLGGKWEWVYGLFLVWLWPLMLMVWWQVETERKRDVKALEDFEGGMSACVRARKRPQAGAEDGKCRMMLWE